MSRAKKPRSAKPGVDNRCRLVLCENGTNNFVFGEWRPESEADRVLAFGNWLVENTVEYAGKFFAVVQFEKPIGDDGKTLAKLPDDPPVRLTAERFRMIAESLEKQTQVLGYINLTAEHYTAGLRLGPEVAKDIRTQKAKVKRDALNSEIQKLSRDNPRMTAEKMTDILMGDNISKTRISPYVSRSTTLTYVKEALAKARK